MSFQAAEALIGQTPDEVAALRDSDPERLECLLFSHTGLRKRMQFKCRHRADEV